MAANFLRFGKVITWQAVFQTNRRIFFGGEWADSRIPHPAPLPKSK
jgi:hypothetical protein